ncbi:MAG TPA: AraC family transcriptional regulator [Bryobacteraceae bacterium]|nr:AraC family transcriptional regulator [Bryobacteraceae bacterium]
MDVLSEVLQTVKLRGALFFNGEFSSPWCLKSAAAAAAAPYLTKMLGDGDAQGSARLIVFHFLTEGRAFARLHHGHRVELSAGDIVIVPHGDEHFIGHGLPEKPVDSFKTFAGNLKDGLKAVQFGGGGEVTRFVCGFMACEPRLSEVFLAGLPPLLKVHIAGEPSGQWLEHSIRFSVDHADASSDGRSSAGSGLVVAKLAEVLFAETLRCYINSLPPSETGWLAGTRDRFVGQALALLHAQPSYSWTIPELAKRSGLSRSRLAERFRHFLGASPMAYLAQWRIKLGADRLQGTDDSVAAVAAAVGYGSEAAFNRAFKREFGCPPAQFRHPKKAAAGARGL